MALCFLSGTIPYIKPHHECNSSDASKDLQGNSIYIKLPQELATDGLILMACLNKHPKPAWRWMTLQKIYRFERKG